jgi:RNase P/RNase MRP subunit POP5
VAETIDTYSFYEFRVRNVVCYYHGDYFLKREILKLPDKEQLAAIHTAFRIGQDIKETDFELLEYIEGSVFEDFGEYESIKSKYLEEKRIVYATKQIRAGAIKARRYEFAKVRNDLVLALIHRGDEYVCYRPDCGVIDDLTIDHIKPLSHGGGDDISNLRFACRKHNSERGAGRFDN